jgi:hypothetical protein
MQSYRLFQAGDTYNYHLALKEYYSKIRGSHGGDYEDGCLLGCSAV